MRAFRSDNRDHQEALSLKGCIPNTGHYRVGHNIFHVMAAPLEPPINENNARIPA